MYRISFLNLIVDADSRTVHVHRVYNYSRATRSLFYVQVVKMSNEDLKKVFKDLHATITKDVNPDSAIDILVSKNIISEDDYYELRQARGSRNRCRDLFSLLYRSSHPETFIYLREALHEEYSWIDEKINEQLPSQTAQLHLTQSSDGKFMLLLTCRLY